jgi:hypothetical protein
MAGLDPGIVELQRLGEAFEPDVTGVGGGGGLKSRRGGERSGEASPGLASGAASRNGEAVVAGGVDCPLAGGWADGGRGALGRLDPAGVDPACCCVRAASGCALVLSRSRANTVQRRMTMASLNSLWGWG